MYSPPQFSLLLINAEMLSLSQNCTLTNTKQGLCNTKQQLIAAGSRRCKGKNANRLKAFLNNKYCRVKELHFNTAVTNPSSKGELFR